MELAWVIMLNIVLIYHTTELYEMAMMMIQSNVRYSSWEISDQINRFYSCLILSIQIRFLLTNEDQNSVFF